MKNRLMTALLTATMIATMTACGNTTTTDTTVDTVETTVESGEVPNANEEKVVIGTLDNQAATLPLTDEEKPVVTDTKEDPKTTVDPKSTESPKSTVVPKTTEAPTATATPKTNTQANATATVKPTATAKPVATTAPKATATPKATTAPTATPAPKATEAPKATVAPTAAPVACQHKTVHYENGHDTFEVPISGGCYEVWVTDTKVCNDCGYSFGESQRKVNEVHQEKTIAPGVSPTCTTEGRKSIEGCDCGGRGEVGGEVIPAEGHDYHDEYVSSDVERDENGIPIKNIAHYQSVCRKCRDVERTWDEVAE